ncbi:MAG: GNAT family N-acetyltransferase [Acidimicrobiales bacterium]
MTTDIRPVDDKAELIEFFSDDPPAHLYALADLDEVFWTNSRWWRRDDAVVGLVGLPEDGGFAVYSVSTRDRPGSLALLVDLQAEIPPGTLITGPVGCGAAMGAVRPVVWHRTYHRFHHPDPGSLTLARWDVEPLDRSNTGELLDLYARDPGAAFFLPSMLDTDAFVGVRSAGQLVAAAGAHVVSHEQRVAAIGAVVTDPHHRRQGLGRDVTVGVCQRLSGRVDHVGLNCADANVAGRTLYLGMGFAEHIAYEECGLA